MKTAITKDFSKLDLFEKKIKWIVSSLICTRSDDVIEAAWNAGIGVHALIWVRYAMINIKFGEE